MPIPAIVAGAVEGGAARVASAAAAVAKPALGSMRRAGMAQADSSLDRLWKWQSRWELTERATGLLAKVLPTFTHAISVGVVGGPDADLRRVWYLALSAAFGRYRNRVRTVGGSATLSANWDVTGKAATVELVYETNALYEAGEALVQGIRRTIGDTLTRAGAQGPAALTYVGPAGSMKAAVPPGPATTPGHDPCSFLHRGPDQITVGGSWPSFLLRKGTAVLTPAGGGDAANVPSGTGGFGSLLVTAALSQTPTRWTRAVHCGSGSPPYNVLTTRSAYGTSVMREWPGAQSLALPNFFPFKITATAGPNGQPAVSWNPGVFANRDAFSVPALPDDGRIITTGEKTDPQVQAPRPPVDGVTRSNLLALVAQSLSVPCFLPESPPCTLVPAGGTGSYVYNPGGALDYADLDAAIQAQRQVFPNAVGSDLDGYADPATDQPNLKETR